MTEHDQGLSIIAVAVLLVYSLLMLGSCSPIHCRALISMTGILTIMLASYAGIGLCSMLGYKKDLMHDMMLVLMLGLGLDDMFVVCNALDQQSLFKPPDRRLKRAIARSGPSITLTSLTDAFTFFVGSTSRIPVVKSFCIYCSVSIVFLYIGILTIYLPILYWDTKRVNAGRKDCFGLLCCSEGNSWLFCRGRLLAQNKKEFSKHKTEQDESSRDMQAAAKTEFARTIPLQQLVSARISKSTTIGQTNDLACFLFLVDKLLFER